MSGEPSHRPPDHLEPGPPRIQPMADELLSAMACLMAECDALRIRCGLAPLNGRREYTARDLANGKSMGPLAMIDQGDLIVKLER